MIGVFVRDENTVEAIDRLRESGEAAQRLTLSKSGIHQQARPGSLEQGAIARTARRENAHAKADGLSPRILHRFTPSYCFGCKRRQNAAERIIAKARGARQRDLRSLAIRIFSRPGDRALV